MSEESQTERKAYHHGDLKNALIQAGSFKLFIETISSIQQCRKTRPDRRLNTGCVQALQSQQLGMLAMLGK